MIDFHTHILPAVDDGASNVQESLQLISMLKSQGVTQIVSTSHYYPLQQSVADFLVKRNKAYDTIKSQVPEGIEIRLASEVYFDEKVKDYWKMEDLAIEGTSFILIEFPHTLRWSKRLIPNLLSFIETTGLTPILVHIEKYHPIRIKPSLVRKFIDVGCIIQCNTNSFLCKKTATLAFKLLKRFQVHCLGTDTHNVTERPPRYQEAVELITKKAGIKYLDFLQSNMSNILLDQDFDLPITLPVRRLFARVYI